jgi:hypothetical protein
MGLGIKNAEDILPPVINDIDFAVNEECVTYGCSPYELIVNSGRPVFHIEYANYRIRGGVLELKSWYPKWQGISTLDIPRLLCSETNNTLSDGDYPEVKTEVAKKFSTVIKTLDLTSFALYCDRSWVGEA